MPGNLRIEWEVKNRFRLFRNEADFRRHAAATRGDGVLAAEQRLARATDGRGWARDMVGNLCIDQTGKIPETCQRDGERENFMAPADHRIGIGIVGALAPGALCAWTFDDRESAAKQVTAPCADELKLRVRYGATTVAIVDVGLPDGTAQRLTADIAVRDFLIAGLGDSIAAGEGNPDQPIVLDDEGFCFRRFLSATTSEYFRPGRANFKGSKACDTTQTPLSDWSRLNARWMNAACHRSLYGYQMRAALALAVEQTHAAVTFLPLACSGSTIDLGFLNPLRPRECPPTGNCPGATAPQVTQLKDAMAIAAKQSKDRKLDLVLLTIGANDIWFAGLLADVITEPGTERSLFEKGGMIVTVPEAQKILDVDHARRFRQGPCRAQAVHGRQSLARRLRDLRQSDARGPEQCLPGRPRRLRRASGLQCRCRRGSSASRISSRTNSFPRCARSRPAIRPAPAAIRSASG